MKLAAALNTPAATADSLKVTRFPSSVAPGRVVVFAKGLVVQSPPMPHNEAARLKALRQYEILDTEAEQAFDDLVAVAAHVLETPIALVSLVDEDRQFFKAKLGLEATGTPRGSSFCAHAIL